MNWRCHPQNHSLNWFLMPIKIPSHRYLIPSAKSGETHSQSLFPNQAELPEVWLAFTTFPFILWEASCLRFTENSNRVSESPSQSMRHAYNIPDLECVVFHSIPASLLQEKKMPWILVYDRQPPDLVLIVWGNPLLCMDPLKRKLNPRIAPLCLHRRWRKHHRDADA